MTELLPCPFPMNKQPAIEKIGNGYEIRCIENKIGIHISVTVRVREDIGDEKTVAEIWNNRVYTPEVMQAVERMKPKKPELRTGEHNLYVCPRCAVFGFHKLGQVNFCPQCGQKLDWSE